VLQGELAVVGRKTRLRLYSVLLDLSTPGYPLYPTPDVKRAAKALLDTLFPVGRWWRTLIHFSFRCLRPLSFVTWFKHRSRNVLDLGHTVVARAVWILSLGHRGRPTEPGPTSRGYRRLGTGTTLPSPTDRPISSSQGPAQRSPMDRQGLARRRQPSFSTSPAPTSQAIPANGSSVLTSGPLASPSGGGEGRGWWHRAIGLIPVVGERAQSLLFPADASPGIASPADPLSPKPTQQLPPDWRLLPGTIVFNLNLWNCGHHTTQTGTTKPPQFNSTHLIL